MFRICCCEVCVRLSTWICKSLHITRSVLDDFQHSPLPRKLSDILDPTSQENTSLVILHWQFREWTCVYLSKWNDGEGIFPLRMKKTENVQIKTNKKHVLKVLFIVNVVQLTNDLKLNVCQKKILFHAHFGSTYTKKKFYSKSNRVMNYMIPQADRLKISYRFPQEMQ